MPSTGRLYPMREPIYKCLGNQERPDLKTAPTSDGVPAVTPPNEIRSAELPKIRGGPLQIGKELMARFGRGECATRAQALSFVAIVSLVPVLLCALAAVSFLIHDPMEAADYVHRVTQQLLPGQEASKAADEFIHQTNIIQSAQTLIHGKWWAIILGVSSLLWAALSLVVSATTPMNAAWEVIETRSFIKLRFLCLGVLMATSVLFILSLLPTFGSTILQNLHVSWLANPNSIWLNSLFEIAAWAIDISMFVLLYKILPNFPVPWRSALFGGVIAGFLWELFKKGFAVYLSHSGSMNKAYGTLAGVFLLITWIYYSCTLLLIGAILCKMYHEHREEGGVAKKELAA